MKILFLSPFKIDKEMYDYQREVIPAEVDIGGLDRGDHAESRCRASLNMRELIQAIVKAEKDGYDSVVIGCHGDPGVEEVRELVNIPVFGVLKVGLHACSMLGNRIGVLTPSMATRRWAEANLRNYGFETRAVVRGLTLTAHHSTSAYREYKKAGKYGEFIEKLTDEAIKTIQNDNVTVMMIGCGALMWTVDILRKELSNKGYEIPFINPGPLTIEFAKAFTKLHLTHSRLFYARYPGVYDGLEPV
jgi:allantoin racemase